MFDCVCWLCDASFKWWNKYRACVKCIPVKEKL